MRHTHPHIQHHGIRMRSTFRIRQYVYMNIRVQVWGATADASSGVSVLVSAALSWLMAAGAAWVDAAS